MHYIKKTYNKIYNKKWIFALAGVAQWIECWSVRFPVRSHAWVAAGPPVAGIREATMH